MEREWNDGKPIYRQLRDRVVAMILDEVLKEGEPLPSVRHCTWIRYVPGASLAIHWNECA